MSVARVLLLFVASRLLYMVLIDPSYLLTYPGEELYRGTIAQELVTGLTMPFTEYRADNYSGGSLVIGALAAGFFLLFGPTVFALKLAPLLLFTLALVFWYWSIQRYAGQRVAAYFCILFCFSPPLFTAHSVTAMGFHSETIFFSALTVLLLFGILFDEARSLAFPGLLGLTAGFGLWFNYTYGLTLLAILGFWFSHDKGMLRRSRLAFFAVAFLVGFSPWIVMNLQTHFAGLVVHETPVWEHFGLGHLRDGLAHPRTLAPIQFFAAIASDDPQDFPRRTVNLLYSLLYLGPILTAGVLRLKTVRSAPAEASPTRPTLVGLGILYLIVFALAVQFSDFRSARYYLPAHPFLFFLVASSLAYCENSFPHARRQMQTVFFASVVVLGFATHVPLLSLDRPGYALSAKGYAYALMPACYWCNHSPADSARGEVITRLVERPLLSAVLPKLSAGDQRELSRRIALLLAEAVPFNGQAEEFARVERLVPKGFDRFFAYQLGVTAMGQHPNDLPQAAAAVDFLRHRSAAAHHLALVGIYRSWPGLAAFDASSDTIDYGPASVAPELAPHYWRARGRLAGRSWYDKGRSLSQVSAHLQVFVPRLDPSVQRCFLQGVGESLLFARLTDAPWPPPAELESFSHAYQAGLLEGWGMALGEVELYWAWVAPPVPTKRLLARSVLSIRQGKEEFEALFQESARGRAFP